MMHLHEDCPMNNTIPVVQTQNSQANENVVEVQCTPTSVVTAGSTTRMLWEKIKSAIDGLSSKAEVATLQADVTALKASVATIDAKLNQILGVQ